MLVSYKRLPHLYTSEGGNLIYDGVWACFVIWLLLAGLYVQFCILLLVVSTMVTVLILCVHHRATSGMQLPPMARTLTLDWLATAVCMKGTVRAMLAHGKRKVGLQHVLYRGWQRLSTIKIQDKHMLLATNICLELWSASLLLVRKAVSNNKQK